MQSPPKGKAVTFHVSLRSEQAALLTSVVDVSKWGRVSQFLQDLLDEKSTPEIEQFKRLRAEQAALALVEQKAS